MLPHLRCEVRWRPPGLQIAKGKHGRKDHREREKAEKKKTHQKTLFLSLRDSGKASLPSAVSGEAPGPGLLNSSSSRPPPPSQPQRGSRRHFTRFWQRPGPAPPPSGEGGESPRARSEHAALIRKPGVHGAAVLTPGRACRLRALSSAPARPSAVGLRGPSPGGKYKQACKDP